MYITVLERFGIPPLNSNSELFLLWNNWNDYNYYTIFNLLYVDSTSNKIEIGRVRIGRFGQQINEHNFKIGDKFNGLSSEFFSLGSNTDYYDTLNRLGFEVRNAILISLNDIAKFPEIFEKAIDEEVTKHSLMRSFTVTEITGQLRRMANGGNRLESYSFQFRSPILAGNSNYFLTFEVTPHSAPPSNINVLIGRNASGKTSLFNTMIKSLIYKDDPNINNGKFSSDDLLFYNTRIFANLILISFSAFDEAGLHRIHENNSSGIPYTYIGLKKFVNSETEIIGLKSPTELTREFVDSLLDSLKHLKGEIWEQALNILDSDPNFKDENFVSLRSMFDSKEFYNVAVEKFSKLSSGHKIILLTITRLVQTLEEKSLVLIDEPETHLHPPLLSSFIKVISELLIDRNGVAIIATHSPVVLQEVPKESVWKLRRNGTEAIAERLQIESFGENVGVLTHEVFGLEVTNSGFHKLLKDLVTNSADYNEAIFKLNGQIGLEAKAILRTLFYEKDKKL
jgi:energy-coupling factor transporter ATP-binding protein EcfA2